MAIIGVPNEWADLIDPMVPEILRLVIESWEAVSPTSSDEMEDKVTETLCRAIRQHRSTRDLPFQVHIQFVELEPANDEGLGRLDIVFIPLVNREDIYFCLECKRLNVVKDGNTRSYASEYVMFGMIRFVSGQYSRAVRHGGMAAYVLNGNIATAIKNVEVNIQSKCTDLRMTPPCAFTPSSHVSDARILETHHQRTNEANTFHIHHIFMGIEPALQT